MTLNFDTLKGISPWLGSLCEQAVGIWQSGGWAMIAIAAVALVMFAVGTRVYITLAGKGFLFVREKTWRRWITHPQERRGAIGDMLSSVMRSRSLKEIAAAFADLRISEVAPFARDLRVMKVCVGAAPLFGLLGTVTGMLTTFGALASGSGGEKTMGLIAQGISEALITTETGLVVALPGLLFHYQLARKFERYKAFLSHMESVCAQYLYHKQHSRSAEALSEAA